MFIVIPSFVFKNILMILDPCDPRPTSPFTLLCRTSTKLVFPRRFLLFDRNTTKPHMKLVFPVLLDSNGFNLFRAPPGCICSFPQLFLWSYRSLISRGHPIYPCELLLWLLEKVSSWWLLEYLGFFHEAY